MIFKYNLLLFYKLNIHSLKLAISVMLLTLFIKELKIPFSLILEDFQFR